MPYRGNPATSAADALRFKLGDTDTTTPLFSDDEIAYALSSNNNTVILAAIQLCDNMAVRLANKMDRTVGPASIRYGEQFQRWTTMADRFKAESAKGVDGSSSLGSRKMGPVELYGGGDTFLGPDGTPLSYGLDEYDSNTSA